MITDLGGGSLRFSVNESSMTAEARRLTRSAALDLGLEEKQCDELGIVVTEVCTNLVKHAKSGELIVTATLGDSERASVLDVLALDHGPGMADLDECLRDGYSTGGTPGHGLGAVVRLSNASDFYSLPQRGTAVLARWETGPHTPPSSRMRIGGVNVAKPHEDLSGDNWGIAAHEYRTTILVADGVGHGPDAHVASLEAVRTLLRHPGYTPLLLLEACHGALRSGRGAAIGIAQIDHQAGSLLFAGVGNISARIYAGSVARQGLVSVNGTSGHQSERFQQFSYSWPPNGILQMHSDGLSTSAGMESYPGLALRDPSLIAGVLYRDFTRGRDDATVVVAKAV